jgi:hypothetical protein
MIGNIQHPMLHAQYGSGAFMPRAAQAIAKMVPHGRYQLLSGQSHDVDVEVITPVLSEFYGN